MKRLTDSDIRKMVYELYQLDFGATWNTEFVSKCYYRTKEQGPYTERQRNIIVFLYNIHCIPKRWENV